MEQITPVEYLNGKYKDKVRAGECIVWYGHTPVEWVQPGKHEYVLHYDHGGDNTNFARVRPYEICLTVEDTQDRAAFRQRIKELFMKVIDESPDRDLLELRMDAEGAIENMEWWHEVRARYPEHFLDEPAPE